MNIRENRKIGIFVILALLMMSFLIVNLTMLNHLQDNDGHNSSNQGDIQTSNSNDVDILSFWESELGRVNSTDLTVELGTNFTLTVESISYTAREIQFNSPNWVDVFPSTIRNRGYLLYPNVIKAQNPAVLYLHGAGATANSSFGFAAPYLEKGFIFMSYSFPGYGLSEGTRGNNGGLTDLSQFNKTAYFYVTVCSAIQALRVLEENITIVDNSSIMVTGTSMGGLHTMALSGIAGERIAGAIPMIAVGDFQKNLADPTKLMFWAMGKKAEDVPASYWETVNPMLDPMYYLSAPRLPPILWQVGTNDEFFHHTCINGTYEAANATNNKWLQINPNGHHMLEGWENTTEFFIDYIINGGNSPPNITVSSTTKEFGLLGDTIALQVSIQSADTIGKVQVCYRYLDIVGSIWETMDLTKFDDGYWRGTLNPGIISSNIDYYFIVKLEANDDVWFSSKIYTGGMFVSNFTIPFYIILIAAISIPTLFLIRRRYQKDVKRLDEDKQLKTKKYLIIELALLGITETIFYFSLILPWASFDGIVECSHIYLFNNISPFLSHMTGLGFSSILTISLLIGWIFFSIISLVRPILSGFIRMGYPLLIGMAIMAMSLFFGDLLSTFGGATIGFGLILMYLSCLGVFIIGIWRRKYQVGLGIREAKRKHWFNIDRIFRIKNPDSSNN